MLFLFIYFETFFQEFRLLWAMDKYTRIRDVSHTKPHKEDKRAISGKLKQFKQFKL